MISILKHLADAKHDINIETLSQYWQNLVGIETNCICCTIANDRWTTSFNKEQFNLWEADEPLESCQTNKFLRS